MTRSSHSLLLLLFCSGIRAQNGLVTQEISTHSAYAGQKACAKSCFQTIGFCPGDNLGIQLGCATRNACTSTGWQADNDCYCRPDLQKPAQQYLTDCIKKSCSVGDAGVDAATAGSIYGQYCNEKGYTAATGPATVRVTTTATDGTIRTTAKVIGGPTATAGTTSDPPASTQASSGPSILTIVGIVVGSAAGLFFLVGAIWIFWRFCGGCLRRDNRRKQEHVHMEEQKPFYPPQPPHQPFFPPPRTDDELGPDDSFSVAGGHAGPAPTLVSDGRLGGNHRFPRR